MKLHWNPTKFKVTKQVLGSRVRILEKIVKNQETFKFEKKYIFNLDFPDLMGHRICIWSQKDWLQLEILGQEIVLIWMGQTVIV